MNCHGTEALQPETLPPETVSWALRLKRIPNRKHGARFRLKQSQSGRTESFLLLWYVVVVMVHVLQSAIRFILGTNFDLIKSNIDGTIRTHNINIGEGSSDIDSN